MAHTLLQEETNICDILQHEFENLKKEVIQLERSLHYKNFTNITEYPELKEAYENSEYKTIELFISMNAKETCRSIIHKVETLFEQVGWTPIIDSFFNSFENGGATIAEEIVGKMKNSYEIFTDQTERKQFLNEASTLKSNLFRAGMDLSMIRFEMNRVLAWFEKSVDSFPIGRKLLDQGEEERSIRVGMATFNLNEFIKQKKWEKK